MEGTQQPVNINVGGGGGGSSLITRIAASLSILSAAATLLSYIFNLKWLSVALAAILVPLGWKPPEDVKAPAAPASPVFKAVKDIAVKAADTVKAKSTDIKREVKEAKKDVSRKVDQWQEEQRKRVEEWRHEAEERRKEAAVENERKRKEAEEKAAQARAWQQKHGPNAQCPFCAQSMRVNKTGDIRCPRCGEIFSGRRAKAMGPPNQGFGQPAFRPMF